MSDREFLEWLRDRLVHVYGESLNVDFVQKLGKIAGQLQEPSATLERYGLQWNGPDNFVATPMADGYWTPWHIANQAVKAAQAQAGKPIAAVHGWFHGECVIRALDPEAVLPAGMALYSQPQAQAGDAVGKVYYTGRGFLDVDWFTSDIPDDALLYTAPPAAAVNQQLLEALEAMLEMSEMGGFGKAYAEDLARAAIAAAQEQSK